MTSFGRGFIPVLRYRTGDLVCRVPADRCSCGRGFDIYDGGIRGRVDDMKVMRGTNVYPRAVEAIVRRVADVEEFQIRLYTAEGIRDEIEVLVELAGGQDDGGARRARPPSWPRRTRACASACGARRRAACRASS